MRGAASCLHKLSIVCSPSVIKTLIQPQNNIHQIIELTESTRQLPFRREFDNQICTHGNTSSPLALPPQSRPLLSPPTSRDITAEKYPPLVLHIPWFPSQHRNFRYICRLWALVTEVLRPRAHRCTPPSLLTACGPPPYREGLVSVGFLGQQGWI